MDKLTLLALYQDIIEERAIYSPEHGRKVLFSEISHTPILMPSPFNCAHICTKRSYPELKHKRINIVIMTKEEHDMYDNRGTTNDPRFDWVRELRSYLVRKTSEEFNKRKIGY